VTLQEIFDRTVRHLYQQGGPAYYQPEIDRPPSCAYRGDNGRKCAAGIWIPDDHYSTALEGMLIDSTSNIVRLENPLRLALILKQDNELLLLSHLQRAHDRGEKTVDGSWRYPWSGASGIARALCEVASNHGLDPTVVTECWPIIENKEPV
jgi:hypothetical protein